MGFFHLIHIAVGELCSGEENHIVWDPDFIQLAFQPLRLRTEKASFIIRFVGGIDSTGNKHIMDIILCVDDRKLPA